MGNKGSGSRPRSTLDEGDDILFQQLLLFLERIEHSSITGQSVSVIDIITNSVSLIDGFNRQTMKLLHAAASEQHQFLSSLRQDFLDISFEADHFMGTLLTAMENLNKELVDLLEALLQWKPSHHWEKQEEITVLDKLWHFRWGGSFSEQLLESLRGLFKQHQDIMEKVQQQHASLEEKLRKMNWLKNTIPKIFAGFNIIVSICSVVAAALHPGPVLAAIVAAAKAAATSDWEPLALWVEGLWMEKLEELHQQKDRCTKLLNVKINKEPVLRDLEPMYLFVNELKKMLQSVPSSEELLQVIQMKESLQHELCMVIRSVNESIEKVQSSKNNIEGWRNKYLN